MIWAQLFESDRSWFSRAWQFRPTLTFSTSHILTSDNFIALPHRTGSAAAVKVDFIMIWDWHSLVLLRQAEHFRRLQNWQFKDVRMIFKGDLVQFLVHTMKMFGPFSSIIALMLALSSATGSPITSKLSLPTLVISTLYSSPVLITDYHNSLRRLHHEFCKIRSICRDHLRRRLWSTWPRGWPAGHNWGWGPCQ